MVACTTASNAVGEGTPQWYAPSLAQTLKRRLLKPCKPRLPCDKAVTVRPNSVPHCTTRVNASWQPGGRSLKFHLVLMHRICRWRTRRQLRHKVPGQGSAVGWESNSAFYILFRFSPSSRNAFALLFLSPPCCFSSRLSSCFIQRARLCFSPNLIYANSARKASNARCTRPRALRISAPFSGVLRWRCKPMESACRAKRHSVTLAIR